jgi:Spy/CpxP family protein refolding chaperone
MVVSLILASAAMALATPAQRPMGKMGGQGKPNIDRRVARMKADLNLTDEQAGQVKELFEKQEQDRQAWRNSNPNPTREEMRTHRQHMYRQMNEGLKKILTPEQYKKHEEMMRRRMHHGMKQGPKGPPQN